MILVGSLAAATPVAPVRDRRERALLSGLAPSEPVLDFSMARESKALRPMLTYPLEWEYRVIGADEIQVRAAIARVMGARVHVVAESGVKSRAGRWVSVHVDLVVQTEQERDQLHADLVADPAVRMVM